MASVTFQIQQKGFKLNNSKALKVKLAEIAEKEGCKLEKVNYNFVGDETLLSINQSFLNHDTFTDIITFDYSYTNAKGLRKLNSEIYISVERVKENAQKFNQDFQRELNRVIFHGLLHLCGYTDKTAKDQKLMREKEEFYL